MFAVGEFGLPGSGKTDVLAFSPTGDVVIIECKLAANPESKRKVIGQILEYAAYLWGMSYEDVDGRIRGRMGESLLDLMEQAVAGEWDETAFRTGVEQALESGAFLLTIVVSAINPELRRIIRYVNESSKSVFSLHALEVQRFQAAGLQMLVPNVFGLSASASAGKRDNWNEAAFFDMLGNSVQHDTVEATVNLYSWAQDTADRLWSVTGGEKWSFTFHYLREDQTVSVFTVYTNGEFKLNYGYLSRQIEPETLEQFHEKLTQIPTFRQVPTDFSKWHRLDLSEVLSVPEDVARFREAVEWLGRAVDGGK